jgi:transposase
VAIDESAC